MTLVKDRAWTPSRLLQEYFGTTPTLLARQIDCDRTMVIRVLKGDRRPSWALEGRICKALHIGRDQLAEFLDMSQQLLGL